MGNSKLCLMLLLSTTALAFAQDDDLHTCPLAKRYKSLHKYEYHYEAESLNAITGSSTLKNGPKGSCKVEIEVPQTCSFIVRTTGCSLSEVVDMDAEGHPVFGPAPGSEAFAAEMEKFPLKVVVEGLYDVKLFPEDGETTTILNVKRGIISALAVPLLEEDRTKTMPTVHGDCKTSYTVIAREDIETDLNLDRDLARCDKFVPIADTVSPLALFSGMHKHLAQLVRSSQTCNYKFDNVDGHMTSGSCTERHILVPFSRKGEYGVTNVGKQELTLVEVSPHNDRIFAHSDIVKGLHMEAVEDKSVIQDKDAALALLTELATLPDTDGERRANLFRRLVSMVRGMKSDTLSPAIPEALAVSRVLTYQVLAQCGTPECSSAIMQILRTFDSSAVEVDAAVFALGLVSNPSDRLIHDMLEMAKYKPSRPIMYALSNAVKRFYKAEGKLIPEIHSVAEFMAAHLGDCSEEKETTFMTLRVIGNMAPAMASAGPALRSAVIQCVNQPAASPAVQLAAVQVYRLIPVPEEAREVLLQVLLDSASPLQKRIAAYLALMKDPQPAELAQLVAALPTETDIQLKSFVNSHVVNILTSTEPETLVLRQRIHDALQDNEIGAVMDPTMFSRNYKIGSVEGNMIFEGSSYLPKEVMLDLTLRAFGFDIDMMEIGLEGVGFEPTVEALFGKHGFFPDTALRTMYFVSDHVPLRIQEVLETLVPSLKGDRLKVSQSLVRDIGRNLNKLVRDLKTAQSPDAMVYLRLLGNELGYMKTKDMEEVAYSLVTMIDSMLKMFPAEMMKALMTKADNTIFAHYIFMDTEFFLPTVTGVPLKIALSGTFAPGIKGGLKIDHDMNEVSFMPSASVEFLTEIGSHIPEYVSSGLEMHTSLFHESGLRAKVSVGSDNVKLTIPAPTSPTKLIKMTNTLVAVVGSELKTIPSVMDKVDVHEWTPLFSGMKYCTAMMYHVNGEDAPYFPFTGDSRFTLELHPTGEVTEYTATLAYELLMEGEGATQKVDSVGLVLRAEGGEPTEARAIVKYNRMMNVITADILIPDMDVEAGIRLGAVDDHAKVKGAHSISLDITNKNIPQVSLIGRANLKEMKEGMLQVQLLVPSFHTDATVTASMEHGDEWELKLKSDIKVMGVVSEQEIEFKYDASKIEVELKSDVNTDPSSWPYADMVSMYGTNVLDMQLGETEMNVRQVLGKLEEVARVYVELPEFSLPEKLFLNTELKAVYLFNNEHFIVTIPVPLGGKTTEELNFPPALTTPSVAVPGLGLRIPSWKIPVPELVVPETLTLSCPLGKAEISALLKSNLYNLDASVAVGKEVVDTQSYLAKFDVTGTSPLDFLSVKIEGAGMLAAADSIKAEFKSSFVHKFIDASWKIVEDVTIADKVDLKSVSKIVATSSLGLNIDIDHTAMVEINHEEISADSKLDGKLKAGLIYGDINSVQTVSIFPFRPEAKIDSTLSLDSTILVAKNIMTADLANGEWSVVSNTNVYEDVLVHVAELTFKENKLSLKWDASALALGMKITNQAEASVGAGEVVMRMETNGDSVENRIHSLQTASFSVDGLAVNSDATLKLLENVAIHKATLKLDKDGLVTSGTTTLQSPLALENTFSAGLDVSGATLSITNKAAFHDLKVDNANTLAITLSSLALASKADVTASQHASYTHDITIDVKPYTASANVNNNLKLLAFDIVNDAQLLAELYKVDLTGSLKATHGEEEIKHVYQINYADLTANAKCSTTGKVYGTHMSQNTEVEIIGLAARITNDARFNSQPLRYDQTIRCSIVPFDFNLDAIFNADGDMYMYGKHSAQLYGKFLLKAQPLAFASSHECRASMTQALENGFSIETTLDNKMDTVLTLQEQKTNFRLKSKVNDHALNQDLSVYNTPEKMGIEMTGAIFTNFLNGENTDKQEYSISGFVKYDKNTDCHMIQFPLVQSLPVVLESIRGVIVQVAEALKDYINSEEVKASLQALPEHVSAIVSQLNIEGKLMWLKEYFNDVTQNYIISAEDVEAFWSHLKVTFGNLLADLTVYIKDFAGMVREIVLSVSIPDTLIQKSQEWLNTFNEEFEIRATVVSVIDTIAEIVQHIDLEKLKGTSIEFLYDIDVMYHLKSKLQDVLAIWKSIVEDFDIQTTFANLKDFIVSFKLDELVRRWIPTELLSDLANYVHRWIQDHDVIDKINKWFAKVREFILRFEFQGIFDNVVELVKRFKIEETINTVVRTVVEADIPSKIIQTLQDTVSYLQTAEVKDMLQDLNVFFDTVVTNLKSLEYNDFVDYVNRVIADYTVYVNELIKSLEIPEKLAATSDFVNHVLSTGRDIVEHLREIKVAEVIKSLKDIVDHFVFDNLREWIGFVRQKITDFDVNADMTPYLATVKKWCEHVIDYQRFMFEAVLELVREVLPDQEIVVELEQMVTGLFTALKTAELATPSFPIPFTDLVLPSMKLRMDMPAVWEIPTQLDIPEFTIMGYLTVPATTLSIDDIKMKISELMDFIVNYDIGMFDVDAVFGDLSMHFIPTMPEISLPEFTLPEISFPAIPHVPVEKLVDALEVPEMKLPSMTSDMMVPCIGKLYGEFKFLTPFYTVKTSADIQNATEIGMTPTFTASLISEATSPSIEVLNYKLDSTARLAVPKMSRIVLAESLKLQHSLLRIDHQGSVSLYGLSGQAQAKTAVKVSTVPYTADFSNIAFIAMEEGMSASLDTSYTHVVDLPILSIRHEANVTQKAVARQTGYTLTLTVDNVGISKANGEDGSHKSTLYVSVTPRVAILSFNGDTDSYILKMKQQITAEAGILSYLKFNIHNEAEAPFVKNSILEVSGNANFYDMKAEVKANHDAELIGAVSGLMSNGMNIVVRPVEIVFEFHNKGNAKVSILDTVTAKVDLQNDYSAVVRPEGQQINTVLLAHLNENKMFYNVTVYNNENQAGILVAMEGGVNLDFLTSPISIPEIDLPFVDFRTPAISDLNLYEQTGLMEILPTTEQTVDVDAKIVYKKSKATPIVDLGIFWIPSVGDLITDLSIKSHVINLNLNAGLYTEDELVFRLAAVTASVFESLNAKLDGTSSLTTRRGIKWANSLSLENGHFEGTHDSSVSVSTETLEAAISAVTVGKITLPVLNLDVNQNLAADTKTIVNAVFTWSLKGDFNVPMFKAVGRFDGDNSQKLEVSSDHISMESSTKATMDGTVLETYLVLGLVDNAVNLYLNKDGLRSGSKIIADVKLNDGPEKVFGMDANGVLDVEVSLTRFYAVLKYTGNNEAHLFNLNTDGKQVVQATIDFVPVSSLTTDIEINIAQPSTLGELSIFEKIVADVSAAKQKLSATVMFVSPLFTFNFAGDVEGNAPVFAVTIKSSATSFLVILDYDMDASITTNVEDEVLNIIRKVALTHADLTMDVNEVIALVLREPLADESSRYTLNVDIISPTFTDMSLRLASNKDALSASFSIPTAGFLGLQFNGRVPHQMSARLYGRYASAPDVDVDVLAIRSSPKDADKISLLITYDMEVPKVMLTELKARVPAIISAFTAFAEKYPVVSSVWDFKNALVTRVGEAYDAAIHYDVGMSPLSVFYRNVIVQYQQTVQVFLDAVVKVLRETQFTLPGSAEMTTLPEVLKRLTSTIASVLDAALVRIAETVEIYYAAFVDKFSSVKLRMPIGDVITGNQILERVKTSLRTVVDGVVDFVKNMESLDTMLVKIGETLKAVIETYQGLVDSIKSDYLDTLFININALYLNFITAVKSVVDPIAALNVEQLDGALEYIVDCCLYMVSLFHDSVYGLVQEASDVPAALRVNGGKLEIELPFGFHP